MLASIYGYGEITRTLHFINFAQSQMPVCLVKYIYMSHKTHLIYRLISIDREHL